MSLPTIIEDFLSLVRYGSIDNSYKMVWSKAIVDLSSDNPDRTTIPMDEIAEKVVSYYWNLHVFFDPDGKNTSSG